MRTIFVFGLLLIGLYFALQSAFNALLLYFWVAYFRPESWVWNVGLIHSLNLSLIIGVYALLIAPFSGAKFRVGIHAALLFLFLALDTLSTAASSYVSIATSSLYQDFVKVAVVTYLLSCMASDVGRVRLVLVVIALSLGFENAKQGWATLILHPGGKNENPVASLGDENETAVGLLMLTPVLFALAQTSTRRWEKRLHQFFGIGVAYRAISTYSRGGFLSAAAMTFMYIMRSKHKVRGAILATLVAGSLLSVLPDAFWERMSTIKTDESELEDSAASRPHFWRVAVVMANNHPLGVGHFGFQFAYNQYDFTGGRYGWGRAVHSSWFGVLAETGYLGLIIFIMILMLALVSCEIVIQRAQREEVPPEWRNYAVAIQTGLVVFMVGGSFVTFQYREILWHFVGITMAMRNATRKVVVFDERATETPFLQVNPGFAVEPVRRQA